MAENLPLGNKIRSLRRREGLTQVKLAERLGISPTYLNLIENNRRPLNATLLIKLAQLFDVNLHAFAGDDDQRMLADLLEVFGDPVFDRHEITAAEVREMASTSPQVARAVLTLYHTLQESRQAVDSLATRLSDAPGNLGSDPTRIPTEEVSELIQRHLNYFPQLESAAEALRKEARLDQVDLYDGLVDYLKDVHGIEVRLAKIHGDPGALRRFDAGRKVVYISELLRRGSRNFQLAHVIGLITRSDLLDRIALDPVLSTPESRALCRVALANYFAAAVLMPYAPFLEAAQSLRYDIDLLGHRFRTNMEQVCHRLTTLRRPGAEGVPFHMIRADIAGNISKRFSGSGIRFARFSGGCPRWNVFAAFGTPGRFRVQLSRMPEGTTYFCMARTLNKEVGGYHARQSLQAIGMGCDVKYARQLVYSDGVDLENLDAAIPIGVSCRLCDRMDCEQRAFPPIAHPLRVDENVRGVSFFAPAAD